VLEFCAELCGDVTPCGCLGGSYNTLVALIAQWNGQFGWEAHCDTQCGPIPSECLCTEESCRFTCGFLHQQGTFENAQLTELTTRREGSPETVEALSWQADERRLTMTTRTEANPTVQTRTIEFNEHLFVVLDERDDDSDGVVDRRDRSVMDDAGAQVLVEQDLDGDGIVDRIRHQACEPPNYSCEPGRYRIAPAPVSTEPGPPGTWYRIASMAHARIGHSATVLADGRVLVVGGIAIPPEGDAGGTSELFDPLSNGWVEGPRLNAPRSGHVAVALPDGRVVVIGGRDNDLEPVATYEIFDPASNTWESGEGEPPLIGDETSDRADSRPDVPPTLEARAHHRIVTLRDGRILAIGGSTNRAANRVEAYMPVNTQP
jgi:hypothetical protein